MRALIVDDERLARQEMRGLLTSHPEVVVVGEAASVDSARHLLATERVDMIFLDIQLAGESGFDLMPDVGDRHVIFVTAFDNHAVRAFECAACD